MHLQASTPLSKPHLWPTSHCSRTVPSSGPTTRYCSLLSTHVCTVHFSRILLDLHRHAWPQSPPHQVLPSCGLQVPHSPVQVLQPDLSPPSLPPAALLRPACPWHRPSTAGNKQVHCLSAAATFSVCSVNTIMLSTARQPLPASAIEPIHHPVSARVGYLQVGRGKCTGANLTLYSCSIFNKLCYEIAVHERSCLPGLEQILKVRAYMHTTRKCELPWYPPASSHYVQRKLLKHQSA